LLPIACSFNYQVAGTSEQSFSVEQSIPNATLFHIHSFIQSSPSLQSYIGLSCLVALRAMESDKTRALRIVRNTELVHPGLPLVEAFLNDAVDGGQAARYLLQTSADNGSDANFTRFVKDWKDLVRLCKFLSSELNEHIAK
jgi:hypothetical protein